MDSKIKSDLSLTSSDDLLDELSNRYSSAVFAGIEIGSTQNIAYRIKGSLTSAVGLSEFVKFKSIKLLTDNGW